MPTAPGTRFGPYEIVAPLGAGEMGEVYRARDTKLDREVAIKFLPDAFAHDRDRVMRFEPEAKTLAALNHPHIAQVYGFDGQALVMELVEGESLAQVVARGRVEKTDALLLARQIAEALEAAHEQGVIHRDLKSANVQLGLDGALKVLDFGLAKAPEPNPTAPITVAASPTITSPAMTAAGVILGTAGYMSPEQATGRSADRRSDMWAFGCVLYELLSGRRAFGGDDVAETLAAILTKEPDWSALPADVPDSIRALLRRCVTRDPKRRLDSAAAARLEIEDALGAPVGATAAMKTHRRLWWAATAVAETIAGLIAGVLVVSWRGASPAVAPSVARLLVGIAPAERLASTAADEERFPPFRPSRSAVTWAPDGTRVVFTGIRGNTQQLYVRALDRLEADPIAGSENSDTPFFSPDGLAWLSSPTMMTDRVGCLRPRRIQIALQRHRVRCSPGGASGSAGLRRQYKKRGRPDKVRINRTPPSGRTPHEMLRPPLVW